jgi:hypothetical protein
MRFEQWSTITAEKPSHSPIIHIPLSNDMRCQSFTQKLSQCTRNSLPGSILCAQHSVVEARDEVAVIQGKFENQAVSQPHRLDSEFSPLNKVHDDVVALKKGVYSSKNSNNQQCHVVLVLGMAFVTEEYARTAENSAAKGTSNAYVRDRARLLELQALVANEQMVMTISHNLAEEHTEPGRHLHSAFSKRAADKLFERNIAIDMLLLDYFRFPSVYMRQAFGEAFHQMLDRMHALGLLSPTATIFVPNLDKDFSRQFDKHEWLTVGRLISAEHNPLFEATNNAPAQLLGDYTNISQIGLLSEPPFIVYQVRGV